MSCAAHHSDSYRTAGPAAANSSEQCACQAGGFELLTGTDGVEKCRCPMGQNLVVEGDQSACYVCASGEFSDTVGNEPCSSCVDYWNDQYRDAGPQSAESPEQCECQEGGLQLLEHNGTTACRCPPGQEMVVNGDQTYCRDCSEGAFSDAPGNEACVQCKTHFDDSMRVLGPVGANSSAQCACQAGGFELLAETDGAEKCRCPMGQNLVVEGDQASCEPCASGECTLDTPIEQLFHLQQGPSLSAAPRIAQAFPSTPRDPSPRPPTASHRL